MTHKRIALVLASLFFCGWLSILYAGADHPPPPGFIWIVLVCLLAALLVYLRVPSYVQWSIGRRKHRLVRALLDGLAAGLAFALLALVLPGGGEPTVQPSVADRLIWFAVLGAVGLINAGMTFVASAFLVGRFGRRD